MSSLSQAQMTLSHHQQKRRLVTLVVAKDPVLRNRLSLFLKQKYPAAEIHERRDLRNNQTVWDIRAGTYHLLLLDYELDDLDELEFVTSLNEANIRHTAVLLITDEQHLADVRAIGTGACDYLTRNTLEQRSFLARVGHALAQAKRQPRATHDPFANFPPDLVRRGYQPFRMLSNTPQGWVLLVNYQQERRVVKMQRRVPGNERLLKRFLQECRVATQLKHPNIVTVLEQGLSNDAAFYSMEYLRYGALSSLLEKGPLHVSDSLRVMRAMAAALEHIHSQEIAHLDIKTSNILFRDTQTPVLIDFGAARHLVLTRSYTLKDHALGTPSYMSPEQATGHIADGRSDLYSLGVVFYEMLTGKCPYEGETVTEVLRQHLLAPIPCLPAKLQAFQPIIDRLLAKKPSERIHTANSLLAELNDLETRQVKL